MIIRSAERATNPGVSARVRPVILCGGSGTRLWPVSRSLYPKQLLAVAGPETLLQGTLSRVDTNDFREAVIIAGEDHRFLIEEQVEAIGGSAETILLEPEPRNTAPAVALAAYLTLRDEPDPILLVMPSDHLILEPEEFRAAIMRALPAAENGALVTLGIEAARPETGYGYIETAEELSKVADVRKVTRFVEKPDLETANAFCTSGRHYWNAGIFLFRASAYLEELRKFAPQVDSCCRAAVEASARDGVFVRPSAHAFIAAPNISIDYAVMERTDRAYVVPVEMKWSDVGSWDAVWEIAEKDEGSNAIRGDVVAIDSERCLLRAERNITVAAVGVRDLVVVATRDAVLVIPRERAQDTKLLVEQLRETGHTNDALHPQVHRPWGSYETMDKGERFQTKHLTVKSGEKLSLQMHHQRSEHWIVVSGTAKVTIDGRVSLLQENQSTYVPAGAVHRIENPGKIPLHLVEVQCGPYLGEDDIVRLEDDYGRLPNVA